MPVDHIRYDILVQEALRGMVRDVLAEAAKNKGMPGEHHFFITFDTTAEACGCRTRLRAQYPEEMTIVLQHQFWDLKVTDEAFEVGLSFGGVPSGCSCRSTRSRLSPIRRCSSRCSSRRWRRRRTSDADEPRRPRPTSRRRRKRPDAAQPASAPSPAFRRARRSRRRRAEPAGDDKPADKGGAEVVRLDRFRKK